VTLAMGVTPYLTDIKAFIANSPPRTRTMLCQFTDPHDWASRVRRTFPVLNVRSLQCRQDEVDEAFRNNGGILHDRRRFTSGLIDEF